MLGPLKFFFRISTFLTGFTLFGCDTSRLDLDLRQNGYNTSSAVQRVSGDPPKPDSRGIISYPNYQVVVTRFGDTFEKLAARAGIDANSLAMHNGRDVKDKFRPGEIIRLPEKLSQPENQADATMVELTEIAESALENAQRSSLSKNSDVSESIDPVRHKVKRGETAFTIARLYNVTIRSLAEKNDLDSDFTIREGEHLVIPLRNIQSSNDLSEIKPPSKPGAGSKTPEPPSLHSPIPKIKKPSVEEISSSKRSEKAAPTDGKFIYPVNGSIIREYVKNKTDGIDLSAPFGSTIVAAENGMVAAITSDLDQMPIIVIKHEENILTVYANVGDILVVKGELVQRGQPIGKVRKGNPAFMHFEIRKGFDSVDPMDFLQ